MAIVWHPPEQTTQRVILRHVRWETYKEKVSGTFVLMHPLGSHLTSVLLHTANALLLSCVTRHLLEKLGSDSNGIKIVVTCSLSDG